MFIGVCMDKIVRQLSGANMDIDLASNQIFIGNKQCALGIKKRIQKNISVP